MPPRCILLLTVLWLAAQAFIPASTYWRDSGEFILSAYYLDITHPPGSPLYSQLANLFALFPFGPIAWRVNAFSTFLAIGNLYLLGLLSFRILRSHTRLTAHACEILALFPSCVLIFSPAFLKQTYTAEVYQLNCLLLLLLLVLLETFLRLKDFRFLACACFIAGLALGNHVSAALPILAVIIFSMSSIPPRVIPLLVVCGLFGCLVFTYIPVRAAQSPPLNTGAAYTPSRFFALVTDARDRALKAPPIPAESEHGIEQTPDLVRLRNAPFTLSFDTASILFDLRKLITEIGEITVLAGLAGAIFLLLQNPLLGASVLAIALGNWIFFHGWQPDPWLPLFAMLTLGAAVITGQVISLAGKERMRLHISLSILAVFITIGVLAPSLNVLGAASALSAHELPTISARATLIRMPLNSTFITEASWFQLKYLRDIEGYRDDVTLIYQPRLLFPKYFEPVQLNHPQAGLFDSAGALPSAASDTGPNFRNIINFVEYAKGVSKVRVEPSVAINDFLSRHGSFLADGMVVLEPGGAPSFNPQYAQSVVQTIGSIQSAVLKTWSVLRADARHHVGARLSSTSDLLARKDGLKAAVDLLQKLCFPLEELPCPASVVNQLAVYLARQGYFAGALNLLKDELRMVQGLHPVLADNLAKLEPLVPPIIR